MAKKNKPRIPDSAIMDGTDHPASTFVTWDTPPGVRELMGTRVDYAHLHVKPQAILITPIGNLWGKDSWWRLQDMMLTTSQAGYSVSMHEMRDASLFSFEAIPMMRWSASMMARDGGMEWCFMVDNDVLLEKDTLLRLLEWDRPIVFPMVEDLEQKYHPDISPLSNPVLHPGEGLKPVRWAVMSAMLFNPKLFNVLDPTAWRGSDYLFSQALNFLGHRIYVDTDTVVQVTKGPARHASKGYDEFWKGHRKMYNRLRDEKRDRRPPDGFKPEKDDGWLDESGSYFAVPNPNKE